MPSAGGWSTRRRALCAGGLRTLGAGTLLARRLGELDILMVSVWHFVIGDAALAVWAATVEGAPNCLDAAVRGRAGTLITWTFLVPVVGIVLAAIVLGERGRRTSATDERITT